MKVTYTGKAWKHHLKSTFVEHPELVHDNGVGKGGTIFINYKYMVNYLGKTGRLWYVCELLLNNTLVVPNFESPLMVTCMLDVKGTSDFKPLLL